MNRRSMSAHLALLTLALGVGLALVGILLDREEHWHAGILTAVAAVPAILITQLRRSSELADAERAAIHNTGYCLAMEHVARGLLDQPAAPGPTPGQHQPPDDLAAPRRLRVVAGQQPPERQAQ